MVTFHASCKPHPDLCQRKLNLKGAFRRNWQNVEVKLKLRSLGFRIEKLMYSIVSFATCKKCIGPSHRQRRNKSQCEVNSKPALLLYSIVCICSIYPNTLFLEEKEKLRKEQKPRYQLASILLFHPTSLHYSAIPPSFFFWFIFFLSVKNEKYFEKIQRLFKLQT